MAGTDWREVPVGPDSYRWVTRAGCKTVLVAVHTVTSGQRLLDITRLIESDLRIQVVFSIAPDVFNEWTWQVAKFPFWAPFGAWACGAHQARTSRTCMVERVAQGIRLRDAR